MEKNNNKYLTIARECWNNVKNIHYLPPAVYGMKVAYEKYIKELEGIINESKTDWKTSHRSYEEFFMNYDDRMGEIRYNTFGSKMEIIEYYNVNNIIVKFNDGFIVNTSYRAFKQGSIKGKFEKRVHNIGYEGIGKYKITINGEKTIAYIKWKSMLQRCYGNFCLKRENTYIDCIVCEEWHNFQNFAKWFEENYYEIPNCKMHLDKDILVKGNKIYSPETCVFVPEKINILFVKNKKIRGNCPIGVYKYKNKFCTSCSNGFNQTKHLGEYNNKIDAFNAYKNFKETLIKQVADQYKDYIPEKLHKALYNYKIEITD